MPMHVSTIGNLENLNGDDRKVVAYTKKIITLRNSGLDALWKLLVVTSLYNQIVFCTSDSVNLGHSFDDSGLTFPLITCITFPFLIP